MNTVKIRDTEIGSGMPKICVPIVGKSRTEILDAAGQIAASGAEIIEWRADWYDQVFSFSAVKETACLLRKALNNLPLLFTFRTAKEGGEKRISLEDYMALNKTVTETGCIDLLDVEAFTGKETVTELIRSAHACGVKVIASSHDFHQTPTKEELLARFKKMQATDADLLKIAVMPQNAADVLVLLSATEEMFRKYADRPIITMSMSGTGVISRLCGEVFGSALTFGAMGKASAPGQMDVQDLKTILSLLHKSL